MKPVPTSSRVVGELSPVTLGSYGVVNMVSVLVSVADPASPMSLLQRQLRLEAEVGIAPPMQLCQSRALPLGYPATGNSQAKFLFLPVQVQSPFNQCIPTCAAASKVPSA